MRRDLLMLVAIVVVVLVTQASLPVFDDALFFRRFATNLIDHGVWAWNPADGAVHGNTSQLWQVVVLGLTAIAREWSLMAGRVVLGACVVVAGWLLMRAYPRGRSAVLLGMASPIALATMLSGMETATTLALGAALLAIPRGGAAFTVLLYLARPDTLLLSVPTLMFRRQWGSLVAAGVVLIGFLGLFQWGYGSALPLSFAVKTGLSDVYDAHFLALSAAAGRKHLLFFSVLTAPLAWAGFRSRLIIPAALFVGFHAFGSIDVMGMHARFYAPCLPWVVAAAAQRWTFRASSGLGLWVIWALFTAAAVHQGWLPGERGWSIGQVSLWTYAAYIVATGAMLWRGLGMGVVLMGAVLVNPSLPSESLHDDAGVERLRDLVSSWKGLEQATDCLGTDLHVYHSEIGVPGYYFSTVTDLGGLMNTETHAGVSFDEMCLRDQPALLFLPHRNYRTLNKEVRTSTCLEGYRRVVKRSSSPLYVRHDLVKAYRCGP